MATATIGERFGSAGWSSALCSVWTLRALAQASSSFV
jgi:hypothetical protein